LITRFDYFNEVWEGIEKARKGINDNEVLDFARLAIDQPYHIRFIECMPIGLQTNSTAFVSNSEIKKALVKTLGPLTPLSHGQNDGPALVKTLGPLTPLSHGQNDGPAARFRFDGGKGEVGFISAIISAISDSFCRDCNRLRLTADGMILPCLLSNTEVDIKEPLRRGCLDEELIKVFQKAVKAVDLKPPSHPLNLEHDQMVYRKMCSIGG